MTNLRAKVVHLALQRMKPKLIARELECGVECVYAHIRAARKSGVEIPHFASGTLANTAQPVQKVQPVKTVAPDDHIVVPLRLKNLLRDQAEKRGKTTSEYARDVLERAILDGAAHHG